VTIITRSRIPWFGTVDATLPTDSPIDCTRLHLTDIGRIARECWLSIPRHFPWVTLDTFVIMPEHIHGILVLHRSPDREGWQVNRFGPQSLNLASVIRGLKAGVSKSARKQAIDFAWLSRYHDHIIRNNKERERIRRYIAQNPMQGI